MIPHDFDMKEFIKWNVEDYFTFDGDSFQMDACRREYQGIITICLWLL